MKQCFSIPYGITIFVYLANDFYTHADQAQNNIPKI